MKIPALEEALADGKKITVIQMAPAIRVSLGELFGYPPGTDLTGKIVCALKKLGFKYVFDTSVGADIAIVEEMGEFEERLANGGPFPMINSCCPGTVSFLEHSYPDLVKNMGSAKSPMEIIGALVKTYFAEKNKLEPENIFSVALMPCVIKKAEALRPELKMQGKQVIDLVVTTKELGELLKEKGIELKDCTDEPFDSMLGSASGGGRIFGSTGGVSEAILRNYAYLHKVPLSKIDPSSLRAPDGVRELSISLGGQEIRIGIINSLRNASGLLNDKAARSKYHFLEIMACLGGCIGGAGQPTSTLETLEKRRKGLYSIDSGMKMKAASENPEVSRIYEEFLGKPRSEKSLKLLHTQFEPICKDCF